MFQYPTKNVSDVGVDIVILDQVDQEYQIPQNLGDALSERLALVVKKYWSYELGYPSSGKKLQKQHD